MFILGLLLLVVSQGAFTLEKAYFYVPLGELKRRAGRGDAVSAQLAQVTRYDGELRVLLLAVALLAAAGGLVLFITTAPAMLGFLVVVAFFGYGLLWQPRTKLQRREVGLAQRSAPRLIWLLSKMSPVLRPLAQAARRRYKPRRHTGLFELDDLEDLLTRQEDQRDNRIRTSDIARLRTVLDAKHMTVQDILIPPADLAPISVVESISPVLLDELHRTRQPFIPVYDESPDQVTGLLAMHSVSDVRPHGRIGDNTDYHITILQPEDSLDRLVQTFYATGETAYVVQDGETYRGLALLADALHMLVGSATTSDMV